MKKLIFIVLIVWLNSFIGLSQYYHTDVLSTLQGQELLSALVQDYKPTTVLSYNDARDVMYSDIDNEDDYVAGIYTNHRLYLEPGEAPRAFLFMNGADDGINCEHSYPRSKGADSGNANSDMHHLYPSRIYVNSARGSKPFAEIPDSNTDNWFYENQNQSGIPGTNIDLFSENDAAAFEPRESVKGDIARSIMYFYTMYKNEADNADPLFFESQIETLCQWHYDDPVDATEHNRTYKIASHQDNKPNPFVMDCSLAARSYCDVISDLCSKTVSISDVDHSPNIKLYPNPSSDSFTLDSAQNIEDLSVTIYTLHGMVVLKRSMENVQSIHISHDLKPSLYLVRLSIDGNNVYKTMVVE